MSLNSPKYCPACGTAIRPGAKFCSRCSRPLSPSSANWVYVPLQARQVMKAGAIVIENRLGEGGMGAIYLAQQIIAGRKRPVVVKEMLDYFDPADVHAAQSAQTRFQEEAATLVMLNHPGIPQIYDYFTELGRNYIVMQFIEGENLLARLTHTDKHGKLVKGKPYLTKEVVHWGIQACRILEYLSQQKPPVIHHDIKPANLIVDQATGEIRLVDFGTAKARLIAQIGGNAGVQKSSIYGTLGYAPPEQVQGQSESRSDVFALAATLYHCLTDDDPGDHPFHFPELDHRTTPFAAVLKKGLSPVFAQRPTATQFRADLETVLKRSGSSTSLPVVLPSKYTVILDSGSASLRPTAEKLLIGLGYSSENAAIKTYQTPTAIQQSLSLQQAQQIQNDFQKAGCQTRIVQPDLSHSALIDLATRQKLEQDGQVTTRLKVLPVDRRCHCSVCNYDWLSNKAAGGSPPYRCPNCKTDSWNQIQLKKCQVCGHEMPGSHVLTTCPVCNASLKPKGKYEVQISPSQINFGYLVSGQSEMRKVWVKGTAPDVLFGEVRADAPWIDLNTRTIHGNTELLVTVRTGNLILNQSHIANLDLMTNLGHKRLEIVVHPTSAPKLQVSTNILLFGTVAQKEKPVQKFVIRNLGGGSLNGQITTSANWLNVEPVKLMLNQHEIQVQVDGAKLLSPTEHTARLRVDSNGGQFEINVSATPLGTNLQVVPAMLDYGKIPATNKWKLELMITNSGRGNLTGQVQLDQPWLSVHPSSFSNETKITVSVNADLLSPNQTYSGHVLLRSNGGNKSIAVKVTTTGESPLIYQVRKLFGG